MCGVSIPIYLEHFHTKYNLFSKIFDCTIIFFNFVLFEGRLMFGRIYINSGDQLCFEDIAIQNYIILMLEMRS